MSFLPTDQQNDITKTFAGGDNMVVEALAGTGKTSTLDLMSRKAPGEKILYVAYNRAIADEAKKRFPKNVDCRTSHSLAYRAVATQYESRLKPRKGQRLPSFRDVANSIGITQNFMLDEHLNIYLTPKKLARIARDGVTRFCYSADLEPTGQHVPHQKGATPQAMRDLREYMDKFVKRYWTDICDPNGHFRFMHDHYLKMFQVQMMKKGNKLPYEVVLFDEAQDSNPCTGALVLHQDHAQLIAVGDRNQQIYGWRGAEDAMQNWPADSRRYLTKSFRFGPAIAHEANKWLELLGSQIMVEGHEPVGSKIASLSLEDCNAVLCRTNAGSLAVAIDGITERDMRVAIVGGTAEIKQFAESVQVLKANEKLSPNLQQEASHPSLFSFNTWSQVEEYMTEDGDSDPDLKKLMKLVDDNGIDTIMAVANACVKEEDDPDLIVSTAHKAKGREWHNVRIWEDFTQPEEPDDEANRKDWEEKVLKTEAMLAYVAVTRAQKILDPAGLEWINRFLKRKDLDIGKPMTDEDMDRAYGS